MRTTRTAHERAQTHPVVPVLRVLFREKILPLLAAKANLGFEPHRRSREALNQLDYLPDGDNGLQRRTKGVASGRAS